MFLSRGNCNRASGVGICSTLTLTRLVLEADRILSRDPATDTVVAPRDPNRRPQNTSPGRRGDHDPEKSQQKKLPPQRETFRPVRAFCLISVTRELLVGWMFCILDWTAKIARVHAVNNYPGLFSMARFNLQCLESEETVEYASGSSVRQAVVVKHTICRVIGGGNTRRATGLIEGRDIPYC